LKATGAKRITILGLFLVEAVLIGIFGATLGLGAGIGMGYLLVSSSPGGGAGDGNENAGNVSGGTGDGNTQTSTQGTAQSESFTPVFLGEDMVRVWLISVGLSMMAGFYPAWKASRYLPVDALRSL
jgi:putative ABC transport system permease protein